MSLLNLIGISTAYAVTNAPTTAQHPSATAGLMSMLPMLIILIAAIYFLMIRPQQKRTKEHQQLLSNLTIGDEVITTGGLVGRLSKQADNFIVLTIAQGVEIVMQKNSIANVLPKGTMDTLGK